MEKAVKHTVERKRVMKKNTSKLIALFLTVLLCVGMIGCGSSQQSGSAPTPAAETASAAPEAAAPEAAAPEAETQAASDQETITLRVSMMNPATDGKLSVVLQAYTNYVTEKSNGVIQFEVYPSSTASAAEDALAATKSGIVDIAEYFSSYWGDMYPLWELFKLPFQYDYPDGNQFAGGIVGMMEKYPEFEEQVTAQGVKLIGVHGDAANQMMLKEPITSLEGMKGLVVQCGTAADKEMWESLGASVEMLVPTEDYDALSKGIIDGVDSCYCGTAAFGLDDLLTFVLETNGFHSAWFQIMNEDSYNSIPDEYKYLFDFETTSKFTKLWGYQFAMDEVHAKEGMIDKMTVLQPSPEDEQKLRDAAAPLIQKWYDYAASIGLDGEKMYAEFLEIINSDETKSTEGYKDFLIECGVEVPDYYE